MLSSRLTIVKSCSMPVMVTAPYKSQKNHWPQVSEPAGQVKTTHRPFRFPAVIAREPVGQDARWA